MRGIAIALTGVTCASCTAQSLYTTPRTVGEDKVQWIAAPEVHFTTLDKPPPRCERREVDDDSCGGPGGGFGGRWIPMPQFTHRVGVSERLEIGLFFPAGAGVDLKWHAIHAGPFDLALMPRLSFVVATLRSREPPEDNRSFSGTMVQMPVLASLTAGPLAFVVSPGPVEVFDFGERLTHGVRLGFGVQWRILDHFALHPEASLIEEYAGPAELNSAVIGLGIVWKNVAPAPD